MLSRIKRYLSLKSEGGLTHLNPHMLNSFLLYAFVISIVLVAAGKRVVANSGPESNIASAEVMAGCTRACNLLVQCVQANRSSEELAAVDMNMIRVGCFAGCGKQYHRLGACFQNQTNDCNKATQCLMGKF